MSLEQKIEALTAAVVVLTTSIEALMAPGRAPAPDVTDVPVKAPKAPKPAAASQPSETAAASLASEKKATKAASYEDVKAALMAVNEKHGRQLALGCLARVGVKNAKELDEALYDKALGIFAAALDSGNV